MKTCRVIPLLVAALSVAACGVPTRPDRVDYRYSSYDTTISVDLDRAPPAPLVEHPPQIVLSGHFWAPGYWIWQGARYSWVSGSWQPERPGHVYVASRWERRGDRWHFEPARYEEHRVTRSMSPRHDEDKDTARHIELRAAASSPDVRTMERRSEPRQAAASVERRAEPSPSLKVAEKTRTEVTQKTKTAEKVIPEKASTAALHTEEKNPVRKVGHTTERGEANETRERGAGHDGGNRLRS